MESNNAGIVNIAKKCTALIRLAERGFMLRKHSGLNPFCVMHAKL